MPPPQLPGDAPVPDPLEPVEVHLRPPLGDEPDPPVPHRRDRRLGKGLHPDEPLGGDLGLDPGLAALAVPDRVAVRDDLLKKALFLQPPDHFLPGLEPVEAGEGTALPADRPVGVEDVDRGETVALSDLPVHGVVGGGDLEDPGPELGVHLLRSDDGEPAPEKGRAAVFPMRPWYRSSWGFTARPVSPSIVSGRVVATVTYPPPSRG